MAESYPISTNQLVLIGLKETFKVVPVVGQMVSAHEAVFAAIEMNRVKETVAEVAKRVGYLEEQLKDRSKLETLVYGCDQARSDVLFETKREAYGAVIGNLMGQELEPVVHVLDSLRKLSASDLKVLGHFWMGGKVWPNRQVAEIAGYQRGVDPFGSQDILNANMQALFPSLMRLQGLGVIYLADNPLAGGVVFKPAPLSEYLRQFAHLTETGQRLVAALPH